MGEFLKIILHLKTNTLKFYIIIACIATCVFNLNILHAQEPTDCMGAVIACGNSEISLDVNGAGQQELFGSNSCSGRENNSVWLKVTTITTGTLGFTLKPESSDLGEDYDFFVYGPNVSCSNIGTAIRCSTTNPINAGLTTNFTGMNAGSTDTSEGPGADGDSFVRWIDAQAGETYYIVIDRPIGRSAFSLEWTGNATFSSPPTNEAERFRIPLDFEDCDVTAPFDDGFTTFDLESNTSQIRGAQTDVTISYHESESDANININSLTSPFMNTSNPQVIYTRITNNTTGCFEISRFNIRVNIGPRFTQPSEYILCDNLDDGDNMNGRVIFNLSDKNSEILGGQDPTSFNISYHDSFTGAELNIPSSQISNSYYNNTAFSEEVFVRIEDAINPDCKSVTALNLTVNTAPEVANHTILQCDEDGVLDGITLFNLTEANNALTLGASGLSTKFYTDLARTQEIITQDDYLNISNPQTIYVEVINDRTSCINTTELLLDVSLTDSFNTQIISCDDDGTEDGFYTFNLNDADTDIIAGLPPGLVITYFENYEDALREQNNLSNIFTNTQPNLQTIYARVENDNDCYGISEVQLVVNALPDIETDAISNYCLNFFPDPITINAGLNTGNISDFSYDWSTSENEYTIEINEIGSYTVTVTNRMTGCSKERIIVVEASNIASIESIDITDASQNNIVVVNTSGEGEYQYSLSSADGTNDYDYQIENSFENVKPGLYTVLVRDIKNNCGVIQQEISVIGFPKFFTPNNDGENDTWQVYGISNAFQSETKILIYNRYGKLLKELSPLALGWDGFFNGQLLPTDDYWFSILLEDGRVFKDHFTLIR